jgi:hypothetical protein
LAATTSEVEGETALHLLEETRTIPPFATVRDLVSVTPVPVLAPFPVSVTCDDQLVSSREVAHAESS